MSDVSLYNVIELPFYNIQNQPTAYSKSFIIPQ